MAFRFFDYSIEFEAGDVVLVPQIVVYAQPTDRYILSAGITLSAVVSLVGPQLTALPPGYDGFIVQRSPDNVVWADISGIVRESFFYIDEPLVAGVYYYRARTRSTLAIESDHGDSVMVNVGAWGDLDNLSAYDMQVADGVPQDTLNKAMTFPNGLSGSLQEGTSLHEGSLSGSFTTGSWYVATSEFEPPELINHSPACGAVDVPLPLTVITFSLHDLPDPGGSGIDDSNLLIRMSVTSQSGGSALIIRQGATQPASPTITCVVTPGTNPVLDRDVVITTLPGYIQSGDVVTLTSCVFDLNGNMTHHVCSFTMDIVDVTAPEISNQVPTCGTGTTAQDPLRAARDTTYSFVVTDLETGVDLSTLQVFYGTSSPPPSPPPAPPTPTIQVLQNGTTFLGGFTGNVIPISGGYSVTIQRPLADPLWPEDSHVCFRISVRDNDNNLREDTCCFVVEDQIQITGVLPISENLLYIEFNTELTNNTLLLDPLNYRILSLDPSTPELVIKKINPQQFKETRDPDNPAQRLGVGNPRFMIVETSTQAPYTRYRFQVSNVKDIYGLTPTSTGGSFDFRSRRTKFDEGGETLQDRSLMTQNSNTRKLLMSLLKSDDDIGGSFYFDDWDDLKS